MRNKYLSYFRKAQANLLLMAVLTVVNIGLLLANATISFPFSAAFPQIAIMFGMELSEELGSTVMVIAAVMAIASVGLYFLCWALSKRYPGAMIGALVLFALDCASLIYFFELDTVVIDILFHIWVMVYLVFGVVAVVKLRHLPPEEMVAVEAVGMPAAPAQPVYTTQPMPENAAQPVAVQPAPVQPAVVPQPVSTAPAEAIPAVAPVPAVAAVPDTAAAPAPEAAPAADDGRLPADFPSSPNP